LTGSRVDRFTQKSRPDFLTFYATSSGAGWIVRKKGAGWIVPKKCARRSTRRA
jgi:hypothetical protein